MLGEAHELDVLRRLEVLNGLLGALAGALDIREVFDHVAAIAAGVLPHDALSLGEIVGDGNTVRIHASSGLSIATPFDVSVSGRRLLSDPKDFKIFDDLREHPAYHTSPGVAAGMRSMLVASIRVEGRQYGGLSFYSRTVGRFTKDDVLIAARIADHVALVLSHHRLAERARLGEELRIRTANIELLDALIGTLVESAGVRDTFNRVSAFAQKVINHDAAVLWVVLPDGRKARRYASAGFQTEMPEVMDVPPAFIDNPNWDQEILDDASESHESRDEAFATLGYRSILRVPIRLDGHFGGTLIFISRSCAQFTPADGPTARRIAERIAVTLARDRELAASKRAAEAGERASKLEARVRALTDELDARTGYKRVVGESRQWRQVLTQATQVAATETTVLLLGESGTGKEVVARFVHRASERASGPFIALNAAALPEQLLEAELFGYERGAFTGAVQSKPGQLELASGGTLFLDEVGEMTLPAQAKFLRVLQEREYQRLGGTRVLRTDARIVAATNRDLLRAISQGQFREDLYYRLNVFAIQLPPLRRRPDDILPLSDVFLAELGRAIGRPLSGLSRDARQQLTEYHWPGNVRELRNVLERAAILCDGSLITSEHLALTVAPASVQAASAPSLAAAAPVRPASARDLQSIERVMLEEALQNARFNKSKAAKALGLSRQQLYARMRKYNLE
jgi:transcriptional regulator with GAF, ATPase, and Fis domain